MPDRTRYVVAFYEIDRRYGGPEEGGWWYDCGALLRALARRAVPRTPPTPSPRGRTA